VSRVGTEMARSTGQATHFKGLRVRRRGALDTL
jgi:hypothetical protein